MQYIDEEIAPELRLIVPPSLKEYGYALQEFWGEKKILIAQNMELFLDFLKSGSANVWLADREFLFEKEIKTKSILDEIPMLLLRHSDVKLSADVLNKWTPCAFLDHPFTKDSLELAKQRLLASLLMKKENDLFDAIKSNVSKEDTKKIVLDLDRAFDKEVNIIRNDMYYQELELPKLPSKRVRLDMFYKSMELLCGDSYSLRRIDEGKVFCFIIDAMAKGVAAALTSTTSTSMMNYLIDEMLKSGDFDFERLMYKYIEFVKKELLDDEIVAAFFVLFDTNSSTMEYASFGTPPFLFASMKEVHKVLSNNMPIFKNTEDFKVSKMSLRGMRRILMYSDGLCESELEDGRLYRSKLASDFKESVNIVTFTNKMFERIGNGNDDIAFFYFDMVDLKGGDSIKYELNSTREEIDDLLLKMPDFLKKHTSSPKHIAEISLTLTELLANALEHGSFGLNKFDKHTLIENDLFDDFLTRLEGIKSHIKIEFSMRVYEKGGRKIFESCIKDQGKGFDTRLLKNLIVNTENFNGRGFMIIKKLVDRFYFNEKGNGITILKFLN